MSIYERAYHNGGYLRNEAVGMPEPSDNRKALQYKFAERFGFVEPSKYPGLPVPEQFTSEKLGNAGLPIYEHLENIVETIHANPVVICVAETGSGKSTQIPQALLQAGYKTTLTQPRRLAAEMLADRIGHEVAEKLGPPGHRMVGYQTAEGSTLNHDTRISVVTDGLRLVQELNHSDDEVYDSEPEVLIIDEVHERNTNIDVLIAWVQRRVAEKANIRVVFTTASIDAQRLAQHFSKVGVTPPIIEVPGRSYPIERIEKPESTVSREVALHAKQELSVLAFLPGVKEIEDAIKETRGLLGDKSKDYVFLPLHASLSPYEQSRIEEDDSRIKLIFATNIAETSITIPTVDVVVDSGLVRQKEIDEEGGEKLELAIISQASSKQRGGRCGRTKAGIYVSTRLNARVSYVPIAERREYGVPEILRSNVDSTVLKVAAGAGLDILQLDMLDSIKPNVLKRSKEALRILGALDAQYKATDRGRRMNKFPTRPGLSRMIVYGIENDFSEETRAQLIAIAAAVESGGMPNYSKEAAEWKKHVYDHSSDWLAQLDLFIAAQDMTRRELYENDFNIRAVDHTKEQYRKLLRRAKIRPSHTLSSPNRDQREQIKEAIVAGMIDFVYQRRGPDYIRTSQLIGKKATKLATLRSIGDRSIVHKRGTDLVVATPFAVSPPAGRDLPEKHIIQDITITTPEQLAKVAANLCEWSGEETVVWRGGTPYISQKQVFRGTVPTGILREQPANWNVGIARELIDMIYRQPGHNLRQILDMKKQSERLWHLSGTVEPIHESRINQMLETVSGLRKKSMAHKPLSVADLDNALEQYVAVFAELMPTMEEQKQIHDSSPEYIEFEEVSLSIAYKKGSPYVAKITDSTKEKLRNTSGPLRLADGRDVLIPHTVGRKHLRLTIEQLRQVQ